MSKQLKEMCGIRTKRDVLCLLLETVSNLNDPDLLEDGMHSTNSFSITLGDMRRLFFKIGENKIMSFVFPFGITKRENNSYHIYDMSIPNMDIKDLNLSILKNVVNSDVLKKNGDVTIEETLDDAISSFEDPLSGLGDINRSDLLSVLKELLLFETGYVRYDYDLDHERGNVHPVNHYDINYSNLATFKLGLKISSKGDIKGLIDFFNKKTGASFLR